jgi:hypothetical protein
MQSISFHPWHLCEKNGFCFNRQNRPRAVYTWNLPVRIVNLLVSRQCLLTQRPIVRALLLMAVCPTDQLHHHGETQTRSLPVLCDTSMSFWMCRPMQQPAIEDYSTVTHRGNAKCCRCCLSELPIHVLWIAASSCCPLGMSSPAGFPCVVWIAQYCQMNLAAGIIRHTVVGPQRISRKM